MTRVPALVTLILSLAFPAVTYLVPQFTGYRSDQLPFPQTDPPLQPAGYAFAIWLVIYGWLILSAIWGMMRRPADTEWDRVRWPLIGALALGTPWTSIANASPVWATLVILLMMALSLIALGLAPPRDRWVLRVPVSLLAGWLTAAAFVSLGVTASGHGLLFSPVGWAYAGMMLALLTGLVVLIAKPSAPLYAVPLVWALAAIGVGNMGENTGPMLFAWGGAVFVSIAAIVLYQRRVSDA